MRGPLPSDPGRRGRKGREGMTTAHTGQGRRIPRRRATAGDPPVMSDVAQRAGVSHQTVSRVLNEHPNVREQTRQRVNAAIAELGYRPNRIARALASRRFHSVGVVTTDTVAHGPASTLLGIERAARARGWGLAVAAPAAATRAAMREAIEAVLDQGAGGLLVIAGDDAVAAALPAQPGSAALVWVAGPESGTGLATVRVDQAAGARMVTEHMLELGHRTVHHLAGPADWHEARSRRAGWQAALHAAGAPVPEPLVGSWTPESGYRLGREMAGRQEVSAVFVANDEMAVGLLRAFAEAGRAVPEQVSVVGFDDLPISGFTLPPLSTVRQDFDELGRRAVARLATVIAPEQQVAAVATGDLQPDLVLRASTGPPPGLDSRR